MSIKIRSGCWGSGQNKPCVQCGRRIIDTYYSVDEEVFLSNSTLAFPFCSQGCANAWKSQNVESGSDGGGSSGGGLGTAAATAGAAGVGVFAGLMALKGIGWFFKGLYLLYKYIFILLWKYLKLFPLCVKWLLGKNMENDDDSKKLVKKIGAAAFLLFHIVWFVWAGISSYQEKVYAASGVYDVTAINQKHVDKNLVKYIPVDSVKFSGGFFNYFKPVQNNNMAFISDLKTGKVTILLEVQANEEFENLKNELIEKAAKEKDWKVGECNLETSYNLRKFNVIGDGMRYSGNSNDIKNAFNLCLKSKNGEKNWIAVSIYGKQKQNKAGGRELLKELASLSDIEIEAQCEVFVGRYNGTYTESGDVFKLE